MRADRLLSIMLLLQARQRMTARDLAQRLEVSERTILRDMSALGSAGIPVRAERGAGGGWMLLDSYRTTLTGLKESEVQALFLTRPTRLLADLGLDKAAEVGLLKLLAALPSASRRGAQDISQRIHVDVGGWRRAEEATPQLPILQEAVWQERRLRMVYQRGDESVVERVVDPLGLVAKGSVWYLVAGVEGEPRSYRVSRVREASLLEEPCARPDSFDLVEYWERSTQEFTAALPRYLATLRVEAGLLGRLRQGERYTQLEAEETPDAGGWARVEMRFEEEHNAVEFILGFGDRIEVVAPDKLRAQVIQQATAVLALYAQTSASTDRAPSGDMSC
ncbi:MAG TPA: YafY family protein [Ktedonobacterales bacterium]|jgi:predicted DNA-binding transcriptional regulator YafY